MEITCGFFIINKNDKMLIVHPTKSPDSIWSIPKGRIDNNETELEAAYREVKEETNIDLLKYVGKVIPLGTEKYKHGRKTLSGVIFEYNGKFKEKLFCESMVHSVKGDFPEVDRYKWVTFKTAFELIHHTQQELLQKYIKKYR